MKKLKSILAALFVAAAVMGVSGCSNSTSPDPVLMAILMDPFNGSSWYGDTIEAGEVVKDAKLLEFSSSNFMGFVVSLCEVKNNIGSTTYAINKGSKVTYSVKQNSDGSYVANVSSAFSVVIPNAFATSGYIQMESSSGETIKINITRK